jgi:hypothetical protein
MIHTLKWYMGTHKEAIDMNVWVSNCILDISTMLTINRDHGALVNKEKAHPSLPTLSTNMGFLWGYLQLQRLPRPITWGVQKLIGFVFSQFKFFERNNSLA